MQANVEFGTQANVESARNTNVELARNTNVKMLGCGKVSTTPPRTTLLSTQPVAS